MGNDPRFDAAVRRKKRVVANRKKVCYNSIMEDFAHAEQYISDVGTGSPAQRGGVRRGDVLLSINETPVIDLVDYEFLTANTHLRLQLRDAGGAERTVRIVKQDSEPLGLSFATSLMDGMRTCKNRCVFCFVDQMVQNTRTSLHVKDDDWRMSFIMGNYVSLTNVDDAELDRIIARRVSPLYISLHASDGDVRVRMMAHPGARRILAQLRRLRDAGLRFHLQVVLCPGLNDGAVLEQTLADTMALLPQACSLAIVPVGLTRFRKGLYPLRAWNGDEASALIDRIADVQRTCLKRYGTRFVFLSDEWYLLAGRELPGYDEYEDFAQIENGVGLLRLFESEFLEALKRHEPLAQNRRLLAAGGTSASPFMRRLTDRLADYRCEIEVVPVDNRYFGGNVNVGGLITGQDLVQTLLHRVQGRDVLIPRNMLREQEDVFLDNMTLSEAEQALQTRILPFCDGEDFIETVLGGKTV